MVYFKRNKIRGTARRRSMPDAPIRPSTTMLEGESRLTEAAQKLNDEEMALLYDYILKPLGFYAILYKRRKESVEHTETVVHAGFLKKPKVFIKKAIGKLMIYSPPPPPP